MSRRIVVYYPRAMHGDGGVTNALWSWVGVLRRRSVPVDVVFDAGLPQRRAAPGGVPTHGIRHRGRGRLTVPTGLAARLGRDDLLLLHSGYVLHNLVAAAVARRRRVPYVVVPHGAYDPHVRRARAGLRRLWERAERPLLEGAAAVHLFFDAEVAPLRRLAPRADVVVAPTAADVPAQRWCPEAAGHYVAWLGRYDVRHKGLDRLLDALALLPAPARPELRLHGRDSKDSRAAVAAMVAARGLQEHVRVGGPISGPAKTAFLLGAAAYVHPARWESYGVALVENLALGVPCILTEDINLAGLLGTGGAAAVVGGDVGDLAAALALAARRELAGFGPRGRAFVRDRLNESVAADALLSGLGRLTERAAAR